jgi:hypothetical protein
LGLGPLAAFIHVNKAIDQTLLLASIEIVDDYPMHEQQLAALVAVKPALEWIFLFLGSPRTRNFTSPYFSTLDDMSGCNNATDTAVTIADTDTDTDTDTDMI